VPSMCCQSSETEAARRAGHPVALGMQLGGTSRRHNAAQVLSQHD